MHSPDLSFAHDLAAFIDASPSPFHAAATAAERLVAAGFTELDEREVWDLGPGGWFVRRHGSLVAWRLASGRSADAGWSIVGAHTDSPNLRVKPHPDVAIAGVRQLGVEVYGGVLLNSWLDRDLGISGRVVLEDGDGLRELLVRDDTPIARVPQLAIHLDREINTNGLQLNKQVHMSPLWAQDVADAPAFLAWLGSTQGFDADAVRGFDLMLHDVQPSAVLGADQAFLAAPRIDNQASCHAALAALIAAGDEGTRTPLVCLFDHEEVGSTSATGAAGSMLETIIDRVAATDGPAGLGGNRAVGLANSACISADGAHATHPNYAERHEPQHHIALNGGPVIKRNANVRYATDAVGQAIAEDACRRAGVPVQYFVNRTDMACGSTIGPVTSARLGVTTVDLGMPQLSMHSAREMCGTADPAMFSAALSAFMAA